MSVTRAWWGCRSRNDDAGRLTAIAAGLPSHDPGRRPWPRCACQAIDTHQACDAIDPATRSLFPHAAMNLAISVGAAAFQPRLPDMRRQASVIDRSNEIHAGRAARIPHGKVRLPARPLRRLPHVSHRAIESAVITCFPARRLGERLAAEPAPPIDIDDARSPWRAACAGSPAAIPGAVRCPPD